jgi:hypothetical protein
MGVRKRLYVAFAGAQTCDDGISRHRSKPAWLFDSRVAENPRSLWIQLRSPRGRCPVHRRGLRQSDEPFSRRRPRLGRQHRLEYCRPLPERVASLTVLSRPHPNAFNRALAAPGGEQKRRSSHHEWFLRPTRPREFLPTSPAGSASGSKRIKCRERRLQSTYASSGIQQQWRRRLPGTGRGSDPCAHWCYVPPLFTWGNADDTIRPNGSRGNAGICCIRLSVRGVARRGSFRCRPNARPDHCPCCSII